MNAIENIEKQLSFAESMNLEQYDSINPNWITDLVACLKVELSDLKCEIEQDKRDAERYRFLCGADVPAHSLRWTRWRLEYFNGFHGGWTPLCDVDLDTAIDAAIAAKKDGV